MFFDFSNYQVEKRDMNTGNWVPVSNFVGGTSFTVDKLTEGHEYEFRVRAENAIGVSEPLASLEPILAKDPFGQFSQYSAEILPKYNNICYKITRKEVKIFLQT